jgi:hypothetical protein
MPAQGICRDVIQYNTLLLGDRRLLRRKTRG